MKGKIETKHIQVKGVYAPEFVRILPGCIVLVFDFLSIKLVSRMYTNS